ncbi:MAG TPA: YncE family protein, partial [Streptosporangiaceae bacterium]|nr:YncE family protein [Streptosporangiaceae bacterium]
MRGLCRAVISWPAAKTGVALAAVLAAAAAAGCSAAPGSAPRATATPAHSPAVATTASTARPAAPLNVYAHIRPGMINPRWRRDPLRVYVPNSLSNTVTVINPRTYKVTGEFPVGAQPNHVTPSWDGSVLYVNDTDGNSLVPINPATGTPGPPVPVPDPYNLYFTPDGKYALVMAEALDRIDFRDPHTMRLRYSMGVPCSGVNHMDFTPDGRYAVASCEFSAQVLYINMRTHRVVAAIRTGVATNMMRIPGGSMPQDVRLSPDGKIFYIADMIANGVWEIDATHFRKIGFIHTGLGAHGLLISRDARYVYVSNRNAGSVSVISAATRKVVHTWRIPGGGSPDMGGITPDGKVMWWGGRYDGVVYAMSTTSGHLIAEIPVGAGPHGLCLFPQPGRYSLGHTG